ncbi:hypothetical protein GCM10017620_14920 [Brevundimonas intermedia]|uniref:DUF2314 domain-containing protein n=1 Tax=Brevundimonas intermedia TaxID=74315 RepID=A0ABQ5T6U5_9CAUL|nr:hypothetical protein [Brevundimonas intermedia]GLK48519.1 hypothetical protein GCM10017620_14920 [Brevundimonas intermedia]
MPAARPVLTAAVAFLGLTSIPAIAQDATTQRQAHYQTRLNGLTAGDVSELAVLLKAAQQALREDKGVSFELLSGAPASYPMIATSPRDAFLAVDFDNPFEAERLPAPNSNWNPYRLTLLPNGPGALLWDVEVILDGAGALARVEMLYRAPHPF